jgi:two-component system, chemotaxis family, protein-glutamate methylesterase/glutaminase
VRALEAGALAALRKPRGPLDPGFAAEAAELVRTVRLMAEVKVFRRGPARRVARRPVGNGAARPRHPAEVVAVGASTGGPAALTTWLDETTP